LPCESQEATKRETSVWGYNRATRFLGGYEYEEQALHLWKEQNDFRTEKNVNDLTDYKFNI
jgi:hypothetical protein